MRIDTVVFDMDGVLFDTERLCCDCWYELAREKNLPMDKMREAVTASIGRNMNDTRLQVHRILGVDFPYEEYRSIVVERMEKTMEEEMPIKPGVHELLAFLQKENYQIVLASSSKEETVRRYLEKAGLLSYFKALMTGDMVVHSKPDPEIYERACASVDRRPEQCVAIEDSTNGIRSAFGAGMPVIMVPDLLQPDEEVRRMLFAECASLQNVIELLKHT